MDTQRGVAGHDQDPAVRLVRPGAVLLAMLLIVDIALVGFHLSQKYLGNPADWVFDIGWERSYGDFFQFMKLAWIIGLLVLLARGRHSVMYVVWAVVCVYYLVDDVFQVHEAVGLRLATALELEGSIAQHVGELVWTAGVGILLAALAVVVHVRSGERERGASWVLVALFGVLVFFGIVVDAAHHLLLPGPQFDAPFTALEDGAELLTVSVIVVFLYVSTSSNDTPTVGGLRQRLARRRTP